MSVTILPVLALLITANALYVAAEFAAVSVRESRIRQKAEAGDRLAGLLLPYVSDPERLDRYIAACQVGITISSLVLGAYGQATLAPVLGPLFERFGGMQAIAAHSTAAGVVLVGLTTLQMVLGELVPKSLALQYPTGLARYTIVPMQWSLRLLAWFIAVLNGSGILLLRLLGARDTGHRHLHLPEEIEYLIAESREGGLLAPDEHERIRSALRLGQTPVEKVMIPRVRIRAIAADATFDEAVQVAAETPYTRLPVYEGSLDRIIGIIHVRDLAARSLGPGPIRIQNLLRPALIVPERISADRMLERFRKERQHLAVVVDEYGGTAGIVTIGDILDEIFGEIADEFKDAEPTPERAPDGRMRLPGSMRLDEAARWTGSEWEGEAFTISGHIAEHLGRVPEPGERLVIGGVEVEVERVSGRAAESVLIRPERREASDG